MPSRRRFATIIPIRGGDHASRKDRTGPPPFALPLLTGGLARRRVTAQAAEAVKIRLFHTLVPIANWASMLVEKKDLARNLGKSYQLEITRFAGPPRR